MYCEVQVIGGATRLKEMGVGWRSLDGEGWRTRKANLDIGRTVKAVEVGTQRIEAERKDLRCSGPSRLWKYVQLH